MSWEEAHKVVGGVVGALVVGGVVGVAVVGALSPSTRPQHKGLVCSIEPKVKLSNAHE